jgi:UPF0716 protein FxsA
MPVVLVLLICWALAEVLVAIRVADAIGALYTVLLLIASWPIGTWALRSQGRTAWRRLGDAVAAGRRPGREVLDGALILLGGLFLMIPGFISDLFGVLLLLPPSRALARRPLARNLQTRLFTRATGASGRPAPYDVDSTATDVEPPRLAP